MQRFIHDFPNVEPAVYSRKTFMWYSTLSSLLFGYCFAYYVTDERRVLNTWYNRPDLKPYAAMVDPLPGSGEDDVTTRTMKLAHYTRYRDEEAKKDWYRSPFMRFLFPHSADWSIKENPYVNNSKYDVYSLDKPSASFGRNDFQSHLQH
jgi:hypothetical protein